MHSPTTLQLLLGHNCGSGAALKHIRPCRTYAINTKAFYNMVNLFSSALSLVALVSAAVPTLAYDSESLNARLVYDPQILYPDCKTEWTVGQRVNVTWNASDMPRQFRNLTGVIRLGHIEEGSPNEHLANTLAKNFKMADGNVTFTVPKVDERNDYVVVLMGDSGNHSPKFTIHSA